VLNPPAKTFLVLNSTSFSIGESTLSPFTMTAFLADGDPIPADYTTDVLPKFMGDTLVLFSSTSTNVLPPVPISFIRGTTTTVDHSVPKTKSQRPSTDCSHEPHPTAAPLTTHPPSPPTPCLSSPILSPCPHRVDLDALERKILRSLREDFIHLPSYGNPTATTIPLPTMPLITDILPPVTAVSDRLALLEAKIRRSLREDFCHLDDDPCAPGDDPRAPDDDPPYPTTVRTLTPTIYTTRFPFGMAMHLLMEQLSVDNSLPAPSPLIPDSSMHFRVFPLSLNLPISLTMPFPSGSSSHNTMTHQSASMLPQYRPRPPAKPNPLPYPPTPYNRPYPAIPPALCFSHLPQFPASSKDDHRPPKLSSHYFTCS